MTLLSITDAANVAGISRRSIQRAVKEGRLSATTDSDGTRVIDTSELIRVYGELRPVADGPATMSQNVATEATFISVLQDQLHRTQDQLEQAIRQGQDQLRLAQEEKARLLDMLQTEQAARRDLEQKLLPAPPPIPVTHHLRTFLIIALVISIIVFDYFHHEYLSTGIAMARAVILGM